MDLLSKTKDLCKLYKINPARSKGQNFLITEEIYDKIISAADLKPDEVVLEVGPGLGFLTAKLAAKVKKVIAVELDDKLAEVLKTGLTAKGVKNVEVVNENILDFKISNTQSRVLRTINKKNTNYYLQITNYKVVANLPYNITSIFLRKFLGEAKVRPEIMVLMLQKEVAERIAAKPPHMSLLALSVQFYAHAEIIYYVDKTNFWPEPEVNSAIIKLITHPNPPFQTRGGNILETHPNSCLPDRQAPFPSNLAGRQTKGGNNNSSPLRKGRLGGVTDVDKEKEFWRMIKFGFSSKRKMLKNNLGAGYKIKPEMIEKNLILANLNPKVRAQELSLTEWLNLFETIK